MEPLRVHREILKVFDLRLDAFDDAPLRIRWRNRIISFINLASLAHGSFSSVNFVIKFYKTDLESALFAVFQVAGCSCAFYTAVITSLYPDSVQNYFNKLQSIRENGKFSRLLCFWNKSLKIQFLPIFQSRRLHKGVFTAFCAGWSFLRYNCVQSDENHIYFGCNIIYRGNLR